MFSVASILPNSQQKNETDSYISRFFKENKLGTLLNKANIKKEDGISPLLLFQFIFSLVLHGKNLYRTLDSNRIQDAPKKILSIAYSIIQHTIGENSLLC